MGKLTRDCLKYGVVFIISTNGPNTVRYRLKQNFKQNIVLQFNDPTDYGSILPGVRKKEPSKIYGRGLVSLDGIYEFQTAYAYKEEKLTDYIKIICTKLQTICDYKAKKVPVLPEVVKVEELKQEYAGLDQIPVGIDKDTLEVNKINLTRNGMYLITGEDITTGTSFLESMVKLLQQENNMVTVIDNMKLLSKENLGNAAYTTGENIITILNNLYSQTTNNICMIIGLTSLLNKLDINTKTTITTLLDKVKTTNNIKIILIDSIDNNKAITYEAWFKNNTSTSDAIWLGNGLANQFTLKVTTATRILRVEVEANFGYVITKGKASLTKLVTED